MKLNSPTSLVLIFAFSSITAVLTRNWVAAAAFASMAAGFALTGQSSTMNPAWSSKTAAPAFPAWRRDSAMLLVCTSITLFGFQIGQALHQAVNHLSH